jgi:hypothetical protein
MGTTPLPGISALNLDRTLIDKQFLDGNGAVSVQITNKTSSKALQKISSNEVLGGDELNVDEVGVQSKGGVDNIKFLSNGTVRFNGGASAYAGMGVYPDPTDNAFATALGPMSDPETQKQISLDLKPDPANTYVMLRWGADTSVAGKGSIALAQVGGTITFGAQAHGELFFGVLCEMARTTPTRDALARTVASWRLPAHVQSDADLRPGTYLIAEVGGDLSVSLGVTFGHTFNWIRQTQLGTLTGDIGLRLQLGLETSLGLKASGKYVVVLSRESLDTANRAIRFRLFKLRAKEFDFALSVSAAADLTLPKPLSTDYHDLVKAALGVHALIILNRLQSWTQPDAIPQVLTKLGDSYISDFLTKVTGVDLATAKAKMSAFIIKWNNLPSTAASLFSKLAETNVPDFQKILAIAKAVADQDHTAFKTLIEGELDTFFRSPQSKWLEGIAENAVLALLQDIPGFARLQDAAQKTVDFLSGADVEKLIHSFQAELEKRTGLDTILALSADNFAGIDQLLLSRLTDFLGRVPVFADIQQLQGHIKDLLNKTGDLYSKTVKALTDTYRAQFNATYQKSTTDTALIDAVFDFGQDAGSAGTALKSLLAGNLSDFLIHPQAGVRLNRGTLTHAIKRTSHVDLTLPFLKTEGDWVNNAVATFNAIDQDHGRLTAYNLKADDTATHKFSLMSLFESRNWRSTAIAVTGYLPQDLAGSTVCVYERTDAERQESATTISSISLAVENMSRPDLEDNVAPFAVELLPKAFKNGITSFENWMAAGNLLPAPANTLVSLQVSIPPQVALAWFDNAPLNSKDSLYMRMSLRIQRTMKDVLSRLFFRSPHAYDSTQPAAIVMLYKSLRPSNSITVDADNITFTTNDVYRDPLFDPEFDLMTRLAKSPAGPGLPSPFESEMKLAADRLRATAGFESQAGFYAPDQVDKRFGEATDNTGKPLLRQLLMTERLVVETAADAGPEIAKFHQVAQTDPDVALVHLANFGHLLTAAFNSDLSSSFVNDGLQRMSPLIFSDAAVALDPTIGALQDDGTLDVTVLKLGAKFPDSFPDFEIEPDDVLTSLSAASLA